MGKKTRDLAALAGLAGLAYAYDKNKGDSSKGPSATAEEKKASEDRMDAQKNAVSGNRVTNESAYTGTTKNNSNAAKNIGFGGGDDSDKNLKRVDSEVKPKPVVVKPKPEVKPKVNADAKTTSVVPGGAKKRTEGNEPMPSLKAVEAKVASNRTDAMRRASYKAAASNTPKAPAPTTSSKVGDAAKDAAKTAVNAATQGPAASTAPANKFEHEMPIARFFKNVREAGNRGNPDAKMASGGMTASRRGDGIAQRGKTRGKMC
jgi:hypothetical protein